MIMDEKVPIRRRRDAGATPVTVVIGIGILVALFAGVITTLGAVAANESSGAQHAADAAALGGARGVLDDLPTSPANAKEAIQMNVGFWADQGEALEKRFAAWATQ
jgi:hypothetical protein